MGKSSLMISTAHQLRDAGDTVAVLDLTAVGQNLTPEQCAGEVGNAASPSRLACVPAPVSPPTPPLSAHPTGPAQEIARRIWEADAMVVLLSESSRRSEMLEYEVQTVQSAAQAQGGKPRLLARPAGLHQPARQAAGRDPGPAALQPVGDGGGRYADRERSRAGAARAAPRPGSGQARASRRGGAA